MNKLAAAVLVMFGALQAAQAADVEAGKSKAAVCAGCHGMDGNSVVPTFPKLAGQHADYLEKQMVEFKSGKRADPIMQGQAAGLSAEDMANLAAFFAAQKAGPGVGNAELGAAGKTLFEGGNPASGVTACKGCHGPNGAGMAGAKFPGLAGQHVAYLVKQLQSFRSGARSNDMNGMMTDVARKMSDAEIQAVAEYIASM